MSMNLELDSNKATGSSRFVPMQPALSRGFGIFARAQERPQDFGWGDQSPLPPEAKKTLKI